MTKRRRKYINGFGAGNLEKGMKTLGLIVVLGIGILAMLLAIVPVGTTLSIKIHPEVDRGLLRIGTIDVSNSGVFTRVVRLPELVACAGDTEVPLDAYVQSDSSVVRGIGQLSSISVRPGETGTVNIVARDTSYGDHVIIYRRVDNFSCLTASGALN